MFLDRVDAGRQLASRLVDMQGEDVCVLGLPRGGVPVAAEVAIALDGPLDVVVVRKLGVPFQPEVAMGAIAEDGVRLLDHDLIDRFGITPAQVDEVERRERATLEARVALLRSEFPQQNVTGRSAIIVDDGIATGATATAACFVVRGRGAAHVIVAAPVGGRDAVHLVSGADRVICVIQPPGFHAVGAYYLNFGQTSEDEVIELLAAARRRMEGNSD